MRRETLRSVEFRCDPTTMNRASRRAASEFRANAEKWIGQSAIVVLDGVIYRQLLDEIEQLRDVRTAVVHSIGREGAASRDVGRSGARGERWSCAA